MESTLSNETQEKSEHLECPRCRSTNTKFCYYNNYNKSQPRHFCKGCKRHWTKGGIIRNVPLGNIRKNKRKKKLSKSAIFTNSSCVITQDCSAVKDETGVVSDPLLDNIVNTSDDKNGVVSSETPLKSTDHQSSQICYSDTGAFDDQCSDTYGHILSQPWPNPTTSGVMDMSNLCWDWNEINPLISADLDIPLDETEITF
ncbi:hypothetical protein Leryth_018397 [Lithospermum erythrorhizon]|nr:hypothetical protein Leryth_018397 [Lithospermum erythrorhizon]